LQRFFIPELQMPSGNSVDFRSADLDILWTSRLVDKRSGCSECFDRRWHVCPLFAPKCPVVPRWAVERIIRSRPIRHAGSNDNDNRRRTRNRNQQRRRPAQARVHGSGEQEVRTFLVKNVAVVCRGGPGPCHPTSAMGQPNTDEPNVLLSTDLARNMDIDSAASTPKRSTSNGSNRRGVFTPPQ
jgi:hypothetical protein